MSANTREYRQRARELYRIKNLKPQPSANPRTAYGRRDTAEMKDSYIRRLLSCRTGIQTYSWSDEIVLMKRLQLVLKRKNVIPQHA